MKLYIDYTTRPYSFLVNDTTLSQLVVKMAVNEKIKTIHKKLSKPKFNMI